MSRFFKRLLSAAAFIGKCTAVTAGAYCFLTMPKMRNRKNLSAFKGRYYAHRGLFDNNSDAPENSLAAFKKAVDMGFGIELDVTLSKDKVPVIMHDDSLLRACGEDSDISRYTLEELKERFYLFNSSERIPALAEVLAAVDGKVPLIVEIKCDNTDMTVCEESFKLLDDYKGLYCVESFNPLCVNWFKKYRPDIVRGQLSDNFIKGKEKGNPVILFFCQNLVFNFLTKPDFIAFNKKYTDMLSFRLVRKLYKVPTVAWTIKSKTELETAKKDFDIMIFDSFIPE